MWYICIDSRCIYKAFLLCEQACVFLGRQFSWRCSHRGRNSMKSSLRVSLCAFLLSLNLCRNIHNCHKHTLGCHTFLLLLFNIFEKNLIKYSLSLINSGRQVNRNLKWRVWEDLNFRPHPYHRVELYPSRPISKRIFNITEICSQEFPRPFRL